MFKRMLLALTFVAALGAAGVGTTRTAMAHDGCGYGGGYGYREAYYPSYAPYGYDYQPRRVAYYPNYYPTYYRDFDDDDHYHHHHNGLTFTFGY